MSLSPANSHGSGYPLGLTGATAATRYVGATASGAPASGTFLVGDFVIDQTGAVYVCTVAGSPGTWTAVSGGGAATDGWTAAGESWAFASASSFTVAGTDVTAKYSKGTRIKLTQSATVKYFVVTSSTFSVDTTVNVTAGIDNTVANSAISANYYSYEVNPQGFPQAFNYTPSFTGYSVNPTVSQAVFRVDGGWCHVHVNLSAGTSNATAWTVTLPIATLDVNGVAVGWQANAEDNGVFLTTPALVKLRRNSAIVDLYKDSSAGGTLWTASGAGAVFYIDGSYQI